MFQLQPNLQLEVIRESAMGNEILYTSLLSWLTHEVHSRTKACPFPQRREGFSSRGIIQSLTEQIVLSMDWGQTLGILSVTDKGPAFLEFSHRDRHRIITSG